MESQMSSEPVISGPLMPEKTPWQPRSAGIERQDLLLDFILTVIVPLACGVLLFIILSIIMFGRREKQSKRESGQDTPQLDQYNSIRLATTNLRYMSTNREVLPTLTPRMGRSLACTPAPSTYNTLSRPRGGSPIRSSPSPSQAPPPYRLPPVFPVDSGLMGAVGPDPEMEAAAMASQSEPITEDHELVPHGSPETLKVRK